MRANEPRLIVRIRISVLLLLAVAATIAYACDSSWNDGRGQPERDLPTDVVVRGCEYAIPSKVKRLDPDWRDGMVMVGDLGLDRTVTLRDAWRRHERADLELKLPVTIEGNSWASVAISRRDRDRAALVLSDVPRRGAGNSYRVEDGHQVVRFEPCPDRNWTAWTAGLALVDRNEVALKVEVDGAAHPTGVTIGAGRVLASRRR